MPPRSPLPLDRDGLLAPEAFEPLAHEPSYLVFAQQVGARLDVAAWASHARRFSGADVRLTVPKRYSASPPPVDGADVVVAREGEPNVCRAVLVRGTSPADLDEADGAHGGGGLALLARRCKTVFLVLVDDALDDVGALLVASILSSVALGPVLSPDRARIFGAKSAREELSARERPR